MFKFDAQDYPYASKRHVVGSRSGYEPDEVSE